MFPVAQNAYCFDIGDMASSQSYLTPKLANVVENPRLSVKGIAPLPLKRFARRGDGRSVLDKPVCPGDKMLRVRSVFMAAIVLAPRQLTVKQTRVHRRHRSGSIVFLLANIARSEQPKYRPGSNGGHVAALLVQPICIPAFGDAVTDEDEPRSAQRDQHVRIYRQVPGVLAVEGRFRSAILEEITRHPMIFTRPGQILHNFAEVATVQLGAA